MTANYEMNTQHINTIGHTCLGFHTLRQITIPLTPRRKITSLCRVRWNQWILFPLKSMVRCFLSLIFSQISENIPQISQSSQTYCLFGQCSSDAQLLQINSIDLLKANIIRIHRYLKLFWTMCFLEINKFWLLSTYWFKLVITGLSYQ